MDKTESAMKVACISLAIIVGFVVIMLLTFAKANNTQVEPTEVETESTTEAETESAKKELEVKISVKEPPTEIIISAAPFMIVKIIKGVFYVSARRTILPV